MPGQSNLEKLLKERELWWEREGGLPDFIWLEQGVEIIEKLLKQDPGNSRYQSMYCKLLLDLAKDIKMEQKKPKEARLLFEKLLELQPDNIYAHYHLGFIAMKLEKNYGLAVEYFKKSLHSVGLPRGYRFKALCYLATSLHSNDSSKEALEVLEEAKNLPSNRDEETLLEMVEIHIQIAGITIKKPYLMLSNYEHQYPKYLADEELEEYEGFGKKLSKDVIILNLIHSPFFRGPLSGTSLGPKQADLVAYLLTNKGAIRQADILRDVFDDSDNFNLIASTVMKVRRSLEICFNPELVGVEKSRIKETPYMNRVLETIETESRSKYRWNWSGEYRIFQRNTN